MPNALRLFGGKATALPKDRFWSARLQLTITYTAILAVLLCFSSSIIYTAFSNRIAQRFERFPSRAALMLPEGAIPPRAEEVLRDLINSLILVNSLLLLLLAALSYWLAGATLEPIQEAYERQRRFLSDASHELRTPLAILHADLENELGTDTLSRKEKEQVESHLEEVDRMSQIVQDLLLLSRFDEGAAPGEKTTRVDLVALLQKNLQRFYAFAKQQSVDLSFHSSLTVLEVTTKELLLNLAIGNILKNSIIYNTSGGTVELSLTKDVASTQIKITDTGIGMTQETVDKIFDRFYRADKSRSRQTGGSGLGLAITQSIITQLHGSIHVKSISGQGTCVTITLPFSLPS